MKRIAGITVSMALMLGLQAGITHAQTKKTATKTAGTHKESSNGFTMLPSGLQYKIITHGKGTRKPEVGDHIELNILFREGDSILFDSLKMNGNAPVPIPVSKPK